MTELSQHDEIVDDTDPDLTKGWIERRDKGWGLVYDRCYEDLCCTVYLALNGKYWHLRILAFRDSKARIDAYLTVELSYRTAEVAMRYADSSLPYLANVVRVLYGKTPEP